MKYSGLTEGEVEEARLAWIEMARPTYRAVQRLLLLLIQNEAVCSAPKIFVAGTGIRKHYGFNILYLYILLVPYMSRKEFVLLLKLAALLIVMCLELQR